MVRGHAGARCVPAWPLCPYWGNQNPPMLALVKLCRVHWVRTQTCLKAHYYSLCATPNTPCITPKVEKPEHFTLYSQNLTAATTVVTRTQIDDAKHSADQEGGCTMAGVTAADIQGSKTLQTVSFHWTLWCVHTALTAQPCWVNNQPVSIW